MSPVAFSGTPLERFSPIEKLRLVSEIVSIYIRVRRLVDARPIDEVVATLRPVPVSSGSEDDHAELVFAARLGRVVEQTLAPLPGDTRCLSRSLVLLAMLARRGLSATLVLGVRAEPTFGAHAWVERGGHALLAPIEEGGQRLTEL